MAFNNLKAEIVKKGLRQYEIAEFLGMTNSNFNRKLSESIPITREEMYKIRDGYFPDRTIDYLFASDGDVPANDDPNEEIECVNG